MDRTEKFKSRKKTKSSWQHQSKKMIGNLAEGQGYADKRKRKILSTYKKLIGKERTADMKLSGPGQQSSDYSPRVNAAATSGKTTEPLLTKTKHYTKNMQSHIQENRYKKQKHATRSKRARKQNDGWKSAAEVTVSRYTEAEQQRQRAAQEHQQKLEEKNARQKAREEALRKYREKKEARHKKLSKRTPRGQPIIKYQMDYLLQKIQSQST